MMMLVLAVRVGGGDFFWVERRSISTMKESEWIHCINYDKLGSHMTNGVM